MCVNFDPTHLLKRAAHAVDKDGFCMHAELSYRVVQEVHEYCSEPKPHLPRYPEEKHEVEAVLDLLKALAPLEEAALDGPALPPSLTHAAQDCIVLGTTYAQFLDGIHNTAYPPTISVQHIYGSGYIMYMVHVLCHPFRDSWYFHFAHSMQDVLVIAACLQRLTRHGHGPKNLYPTLCNTQRVEDRFSHVCTIVVDRNCSIVELVVWLCAALVVATI